MHSLSRVQDGPQRRASVGVDDAKVQRQTVSHLAHLPLILGIDGTGHLQRLVGRNQCHESARLSQDRNDGGIGTIGDLSNLCNLDRTPYFGLSTVAHRFFDGQGESLLKNALNRLIQLFFGGEILEVVTSDEAFFIGVPHHAHPDALEKHHVVGVEKAEVKLVCILGFDHQPAPFLSQVLAY